MPMFGPMHISKENSSFRAGSSICKEPAVYPDNIGTACEEAVPGTASYSQAGGNNMPTITETAHPTERATP